MIILKILLSLLLYLGIPTLLVLIVPGLGAVTATGLGELIALPFLLFLYEKEQRRRQHFTYAPRFLKDKAPLLVIALGAASCIGLNGLLTLSRLDLLFPAFSQEVAAELYAPPLPLHSACGGAGVPGNHLCFNPRAFFLDDRCRRLLPALRLVSRKRGPGDLRSVPGFSLRLAL